MVLSHPTSLQSDAALSYQAKGAESNTANEQNWYTQFDCVLVFSAQPYDDERKACSTLIAHLKWLSQFKPVFYIQADLRKPKAGCLYEAVQKDDITVFKVYRKLDRSEIVDLIQNYVRKSHFSAPLIYYASAKFIDSPIIFPKYFKLFAPTVNFIQTNAGNNQLKLLFDQAFKKANMAVALDAEVQELMNLYHLNPEEPTDHVVSYQQLQESLQESSNESVFKQLDQLIVDSYNAKLLQYSHKPLNVLMLYCDTATHINTVAEYLESFRKYSRHQYQYAVATKHIHCLQDLSYFDVIMINYSVRVSLPDFLSPHVAQALKQFAGKKLLYIQDEYDTTETARQWIETLGIDTVFTCVPDPYIHDVYSKERFGNLDFINVLTGYVPHHLENLTDFVPMEERPNRIVYRGRVLPYWYGSLGYDKYIIGKRFKEICTERGIPHDIEVDDSKRIYGDGWYDFIQSGRATIGSESGANVFDDYGTIKKGILKDLEANPDLSYEEIAEKWINEHEGKVLMNQVSPRVFEAVALKTALVLFEGGYSGVVEPYTHYLPLKKDFSNVDEVLAKLEDIDYLNEMTERAYKDIVASKAYSYQTYVGKIDEYLDSLKLIPKGYQLIQGVIGYYMPEDTQVKFFTPHSGASIPMPGLLTYEMTHRDQEMMALKKQAQREKRTLWQTIGREAQRVFKKLSGKN